MGYSLYYFDYHAFMEEARPLMEMADKGNYISVVNHAKAIAASIPTGEWILEGEGTTIWYFDKLAKQPGPQEVAGFSLLVVLSKYLSPTVAEEQAYNYLRNINIVFQELGAKSSDTLLMRSGLWLGNLLKPEKSDLDNPLDRPEIPDERWSQPEYYWWWVRPYYDVFSGWLDLKSVEYLLNLWKANEDRYYNYDFNTIRNQKFVDRYFSSLEHFQMIREVFEEALEKQIGFYLLEYE